MAELLRFGAGVGIAVEGLGVGGNYCRAGTYDEMVLQKLRGCIAGLDILTDANRQRTGHF